MTSIEKYGGYDSVTGAYFMLVEHEVVRGQRKEIVRTIEYVPLTLSKKLENNIKAQLDYCINKLELLSPRIIIPKIKYNTLFLFDGFKLHSA